MAETIKINLVDPDKWRRARVAEILTGLGWRLEFHDGLAALLPDMLASDFWLVVDEDDFVSTIAQMAHAADRPAAIIAYSPEPQVRAVVAAMRGGACDYLVWPVSVADVVEAIEKVQSIVRPRIVQWHRAARSRNRVQLLTNREREVLISVAMGATNREIADRLGISHRTVEVHRANMLTKLKAASSPEAVRIAIDAGLIN